MLDALSGQDLFLIWLGMFISALILSALLSKVVAKLTAISYRRHATNKTTIIAEYAPPNELSAYELGYLYDNEFGNNELLAALIGLEQKKVLKLNFDGPSVIDIHANSISDATRQQLSGSELTIYGLLLHDDQSDTTWAELSSAVSEATGPESIFESSAFNDLHDKGYLDQNGIFSTLRERKIGLIVVSLVLSLILIVLPVYLVANSHASYGSAGYASLDRDTSMIPIVLLFLIAWPIIYGCCHLVAYIYFRSAGLPIGSTIKLRSQWPVIVGYREYLKTVELSRLDADTNMSDPMMSYIIAYGLYPTKIRRLISE